MLPFLNIIGYTAGVFTTFGSLPQIIRAIKTKSTKDLSYTSLFIIAIGAILWTVYGVLLKNGPLIVWDTIIFILYTTLIILKFRYDHPI